VTILFTGDHGEIRGCDARLALVTLVSLLQQRASELNAMEIKVLRVLCYLAELQHIAYSLEQTRTRRLILRAYNLGYQLATAIDEVVPAPRKIGRESWKGAGFHNITVHLPEQLELGSLRSTVAEQAERKFHFIR